MATIDQLENDRDSSRQMADDSINSVKVLFKEWLSDQQKIKASVDEIVECINNVTEYTTIRDIFRIDLWAIHDFDSFNRVYSKILSSNQFRVTFRDKYKTFIVAGQYYLQYIRYSDNKVQNEFEQDSAGEISVESEEDSSTYMDDKPVMDHFSSSSVQTTGDIIAQKKLQHKKEVDWFFINCGFKVLRSQFNGDVPKGGRLPIHIVLNQEKYDAFLINIGMSNIDNGRYLVSYSSNSSLSLALNEVFAQSTAKANPKNELNSNQGTYIKGYVDIIKESDTKIRLVCYPLNCHVNMKTLSVENKLEANDSNNYRENDFEVTSNIETEKIFPEQAIIDKGETVRQPEWNQYEAALLIEAFWKVKENRSSRRSIVSGLSDTLRSRASRQGITIDQIFRNENGIRMRLEEIEFLFFGDGVGLKHTSKLFREMVQLYKTDVNEFNKVLKEAQRDKAVQDEPCKTFQEWLTEKEPKVQPDFVCRLLTIAEDYCIKVNVLSVPLFETTDEDTIKKFVRTINLSKVFRAKYWKQIRNIISAANWYYAYIRDIHNNMLSEDSVKATPTESTVSVGKALLRECEIMNSIIKNDSSELTEEMSALLKSNKEGITKEAILEQFSNFSTHQVNRSLLACHSVKVLKKYYHKDNILYYDEMADILLDVLTKQFATNGDYTSALQLYNDAHLRLDDFFFYNNAFESRAEMFDLAVHLFSQEKYKDHSFLFVSGMHIWKEEPNYPKEFGGLLIKYAREHQNVFTREQALAYFESIGSTTPGQSFSYILSNSSKPFIQYAENCFVLKEALDINDNFLSALRTQIEYLLEGDDYIAFGEIDDYFYSTLPTIPVNIRWSPLLLEDVLCIFDIGYTVIEAGKESERTTIPAAILKNNSSFRTFSDIVWNEMSKEYSLPKEFTASEFREFLLNKGFIHGSEKMWSVHKTVAGDLRFYWTEKNSKVTIN